MKIFLIKNDLLARIRAEMDKAPLRHVAIKFVLLFMKCREASSKIKRVTN